MIKRGRAVYNHWIGLDWTGLKNLMNDFHVPLVLSVGVAS